MIPNSLQDGEKCGWTITSFRLLCESKLVSKYFKLCGEGLSFHGAEEVGWVLSELESEA